MTSQMISPKRKFSGDEDRNDFRPSTFEPENDQSVNLNSPRVIRQTMDSSFVSQMSSFEQSFLNNVGVHDLIRKIDLPDPVLVQLVLFLGKHSLLLLKMLSKDWYSRIDHLLGNMCLPMEDGFILQYREFLTIKNKRLVFSPTEFSNYKGLRIDRILEVELKEYSPEVMYNAGRTFKIESMHSFLANTAPYQSTQMSVVYRPTTKRKPTDKPDDEIIYSNCYRFDIVKSRKL